MRRARSPLWGIAAAAIALVSVWTQLTSSWVALDEGTIALAARYVGLGYLPHHDFAYPYTGAQAAWDALAMRIVGDSMAAPRIALFATFVAWLPAVWFLARKLVGPVGAAATLVLASWWSLYVYPAAMPTWYLLFLSTWTLVALAAWRGGGGTRWLVFTGVLCGAAVTIKQTGLYLLLAALAGVLAHDQDRVAAGTADSAANQASPASPASAASRRTRSVAVVLLLAAIGVVPALVLTRRGIASGELLTLALPAFFVVAGLATREWRLLATGDRPGAAVLFRSWGMVLAGAAVPMSMLVAWYAKHGAVGALVDGAFLRGLTTAATIDRAAPPAAEILVTGAIAYAIALLVAAPPRLFHRFFGGTLVALALSVWAMYSVFVYRVAWFGAQLLVPVGAALAAVIATRPHAAVRDRAFGTQLIALAGVMVLLALNQFPYAAPNYFAYVAPLAMLIGAALAGASRRDAIRMVPGMAVVTRAVRTPFLVLLFVLFGGWFHRIGSVQTVGEGSVWWDDAHALPGAHAGLFATRGDSATHARLLDLIRTHGGPDRFAAGPELPQLYVLAGTTRLVPQPFLLGPAADADTAALPRALDPSLVDVVAINHAPLFLAPPSAAARAWIERRFPNVERVEDIEVRWRNTGR